VAGNRAIVRTGVARRRLTGRRTGQWAHGLKPLDRRGLGTLTWVEVVDTCRAADAPATAALRQHAAPGLRYAGDWLDLNEIGRRELRPSGIKVQLALDNGQLFTVGLVHLTNGALTGTQVVGIAAGLAGSEEHKSTSHSSSSPPPKRTTRIALTR
jgi:hypothetical protein